MYKCPTCGAGLVFDPKSQELLCLSCRNKYDPENVDNMKLDQASEKLEQNEQSYEAISYKCSHCGAELITTDETITTFCSFCRTGTMLDRKIIKKKKPDYIIPFSITKEECEQIYINKIKKSFFAPKTMIDSQEVKKIRGIYMPYWIYSFERHGNVNTKGQKYNHRSGDYVYYDDYSLETKVDVACKGVTHDATSSFWDRLSEAIAPYSVKKKKAFSPAYLSGFYADNEDLGEEVYTEDSKKIAEKFATNELSKDKEYGKYSAKPNVKMELTNVELALFPVYYLATKNRTGDRISYAVINGQTGKIAADIPIDFKKLIFSSLGLAIPIFILLSMLFTFNMPTMIGMAIVFNIISICMLGTLNKKIKRRENEQDDIGVQHKLVAENNGQNTESVKPEKTKNNFKVLGVVGIIILLVLLPILLQVMIVFIAIVAKIAGDFVKTALPQVAMTVAGAAFAVVLIWIIIRKIKTPQKDSSMFKPVVGLMISLLIFLINPASDIYYYAAAFTSIAFSAWTFKNIIDKYNILSSRKLPGLGKRGGDENA